MSFSSIVIAPDALYNVVDAANGVVIFSNKDVEEIINNLDWLWDLYDLLIVRADNDEDMTSAFVA